MGTTVNSATASVAVSSIKPRASVAVVVPQLGVTYQLPVAGIEYILIQVAAESDSSGLYQYKTDTVAVIDSKIISVAKQFSELLGVADATVKSTNKLIADSISFSEVVVTVLIFIRNFADSINVPDALAIDYLKQLADQVSLSDSDTLDFSKGISDGVAMSDDADIDFDLQKYIMNMAFVADAETKSFSKSLYDIATLVDLFSYEFNKPLADSFSLTESTSLIQELLKSESIIITDALAKEFAKTVTADSINSTDAVSLEPSKAMSDTATIDDAGSLLSQGYCDITYFAEDYVGSSRSFT